MSHPYSRIGCMRSIVAVGKGGGGVSGLGWWVMWHALGILMNVLFVWVVG